MSWRLQGRNLVPIITYLTASIGYTGSNVTKLNNIGSFLNALKDVWILAGDFNMPPEQLAKSGWLEKVGGKIIVPHNVEFTCTAGTARLIDYAVVPEGAEIFFRDIAAVEDDAFLSHFGLEVEIDCVPLASIRWSIRLPAPFPHPPLPPRRADPNSKTSRAKLARAAQRDPAIDRRDEERMQELAQRRAAKKAAACALHLGKPPPASLVFPSHVCPEFLGVAEPEQEDLILQGIEEEREYAEHIAELEEDQPEEEPEDDQEEPREAPQEMCWKRVPGDENRRQMCLTKPPPPLVRLGAFLLQTWKTP